MIENLQDVFNKFEKEFLKFEKVTNPPSNRPDVCAFILLDKLVPKRRDMISAAEHDEIFLDIGHDELAKVTSEDDILYLVRCGVRYNSETESLAMFV